MCRGGRQTHGSGMGENGRTDRMYVCVQRGQTARHMGWDGGKQTGTGGTDLDDGVDELGVDRLVDVEALGAAAVLPAVEEGACSLAVGVGAVCIYVCVFGGW